jgi:oxalate decarboxylase/phosphoglucose isomerase-like protein (cupin superfamily)
MFGKKITKKVWGTIELLAEGKDWRIDKITIKPGMSDHLHHHPSLKHTCYVAEGCGTIEVGQRKSHLVEADLTAGAEFIINSDWLHRYENTGEQDLVIIQSSYGKFNLKELGYNKK